MASAAGGANAPLVNADIEGDVSKKVIIHAMGVGNAPKLDKPKFSTSEASSLAKVAGYLRRLLKLKPDDALYFFVKNSFQPPMDSRVKDLTDVSCCLLVWSFYHSSLAWGFSQLIY